MKYLYIIFAFYVLMLSVKPCCTDDNCNDENQSLKTEQSGNNQQENDCKGNCIPFFTCNSCVGFTFVDSIYLFNISNCFVVKNIISNQPEFVENYFADIWQPPKIS